MPITLEQHTAPSAERIQMIGVERNSIAFRTTVFGNLASV